jgi:genome maintenance exonuclease 1
MKLNPIYDYPTVTSATETNGRRKYNTPSGPVPSVTTVLSGTKDMTFLREWKKRVGEAEAEKIVKRSTRLGTGVHNNLEKYILEGAEPEGDIFTRAMTKKIIENGLKKVDEIWGCEVSLYADGLYAGTTDAVGLHEGVPAIIDFKNARSFRKDEWIGDYKLQVAAYALAHNELFGTNINRGVIMLATQQGHYQEWIIEGPEFVTAAGEWEKRLIQYYEKYR